MASGDRGVDARMTSSKLASEVETRPFFVLSNDPVSLLLLHAWHALTALFSMSNSNCRLQFCLHDLRLVSRGGITCLAAYSRDSRARARASTSMSMSLSHNARHLAPQRLLDLILLLNLAPLPSPQIQLSRSSPFSQYFLFVTSTFV